MDPRQYMLSKSIRVQLFSCIFFIPLLIGCEAAHYYSQAISGQLSILNNRQSIDQILVDPQTPAELKKKLGLIMGLREFAKAELHLPVNDNYLSFVNLKRPFALWNVYAAPEFSLKPKTWCYPIVGCAAYRGFFSKRDAYDYATKLNSRGYDTFVGGVTAYSTLGWFDDPVLSTFINRSDTKLAALIFHELAHQLLYVEDDTTFNESFATAVEQEGLRRWLISKFNPDAFDKYKVDYLRHQQFIQLIMKYRKQLESLYIKDISVKEKRGAKALVFDRLRGEYKLLKSRWEGYSGYDSWFSDRLNNAKIITVSTYYDLVPAFLRLLRANDNNLEVFYKKCLNLVKKSQEERHSYLKQF